MRICHITSIHPWFDDRIFERAARGQARRGHEVTLIVQCPKADTVGGVRLVPLKERTGWRRRIISSWEAYRKARQINADIYHFHDPDLVPWMLLLRGKGRIVIFDMHEYYPSRLLDSRLPGWLKRLIAPLWLKVDGWFAGRFDGLIAVSDSHADLYRSFNPHREVVHNTVDLERIAPHFQEPPKEERPVIYTSGTNTATRNCLEAVEALPLIVREFPDVVMRFVGRYRPASYEEQLRRRGEELGVAANLEILGMIPWEENFIRTARAQIGCLFYHDIANYRIGLANRLFEYMFCGVAILGEDFPEVRRILRDADCGLLVDSSRPESIAQGALELLRNPERMAGMGRNGRKAMLERYHYGLELDKMDRFYAELISARSGPTQNSKLKTQN